MTKTPKALLKAYKLVNSVAEEQIPKKNITIRRHWNRYLVHYTQTSRPGWFICNQELELTPEEFKEYEKYVGYNY